MQYNNSDDLSGHISFHKKWLQDRQYNNYKSMSKEDQSPRERFSFTQATAESPRQTLKNTTFVSGDQYRDDESFEGLKPLNETMTKNIGPILPLETEEMDQSTFYQYKSYYEETVKEPPRWETLYQLDKKIRKHKDQLEKEAYERELDSECTFQPKLNAPFNFQRYEYSLPLHERNKMWKQDREERMAIIRDEKEIRKMKECTFQPNLTHHRMTSATVKDPSPYQFQGIHNYLNRQLNARKHKEEIDYMFETSFSKSPQGGSRRDSSVTTPRVPSLQTEIRAVEYIKRKEKSPKSGASRPKSPHRQINLAHTDALAAGHAAYRLYDALETGSDFGREKDKGFAKAIESLHNELHRFELNY